MHSEKTKQNVISRLLWKNLTGLEISKQCHVSYEYVKLTARSIGIHLASKNMNENAKRILKNYKHKKAAGRFSPDSG